MKVKSEARRAAILETATDPFIKAEQFLSLITTETNVRFLERDPLRFPSNRFVPWFYVRWKCFSLVQRHVEVVA